MNTLTWIENWLKDSKQRVIIKGSVLSCGIAPVSFAGIGRDKHHIRSTDYIKFGGAANTAEDREIVQRQPRENSNMKSKIA